MSNVMIVHLVLVPDVQSDCCHAPVWQAEETEVRYCGNCKEPLK